MLSFITAFDLCCMFFPLLFSKAIHLLDKAAQAGNPSAIYNMGLCFEHGKGVLEDHCKVI